MISAEAAEKNRRARSAANSFVTELSALSFSGTFNPWNDVCPDNDRVDAPAIRRDNLLQVLNAALREGADQLWVGRDLGYLGGRRTGLAMTDEPHMDAHARMWGLPNMARATIGPACDERTAKEVWYWLKRLGVATFLWNVFPLHPHMAGNPHSNRPHTRAERDATIHLLAWLYRETGPKKVVALGRDAQRSLADLGIPYFPVRHPSMGGLPEFRRAMAVLLAR